MPDAPFTTEDFAGIDFNLLMDEIRAKRQAKGSPLTKDDFKDFILPQPAGTMKEMGYRPSIAEQYKMDQPIGPPPTLTGPNYQGGPSIMDINPLLAKVIAPVAETAGGVISKVGQSWGLPITPDQPLLEAPSIRERLGEEDFQNLPGYQKALVNFADPLMQTLSSFTTPEAIGALPFATMRAVPAPIRGATQAGFMGGAMAQIPEALQQAAAAPSWTEAVRPLTEAGVSGAIGFGILGAQGRAARMEAIRSKFLDLIERERQRAREIGKTTTVHGAMRTQPGEGEGQVPVEEGGAGVQPQTQGGIPSTAQVLLTPQEEAYIDAHRDNAIYPVDIVPDVLPEDHPHAGKWATIDPVTKRIKIFSPAFRDYVKGLERDGLSPDQIRQAVGAGITSEEVIHMIVHELSKEVGIDLAGEYWKTLTGPEKMIAKKIYAGKNVDLLQQQLTDTEWGHEALRYRLEQLLDRTPRELLEEKFWQRLGYQSIDALARAIQAGREFLRTGPAIRGVEIRNAVLDNMEIKLGAVRAAAGAAAATKEEEGGPTPGARGKKKKPAEDPDGKDFIGDITQGGVRGQRVWNSIAEQHGQRGLDSYNGWRYRAWNNRVLWDVQPSPEQMHSVEDFLSKHGIEDVAHHNAFGNYEWYGGRRPPGEPETPGARKRREPSEAHKQYLEYVDNLIKHLNAGIQGEEMRYSDVGASYPRAEAVIDDFFRNDPRGQAFFGQMAQQGQFGEEGLRTEPSREQILSFIRARGEDYLRRAAVVNARDPYSGLEAMQTYGEMPKKVIAAILRKSAVAGRTRMRPVHRDAINRWIDEQIGPEESTPGARGRGPTSQSKALEVLDDFFRNTPLGKGLLRHYMDLNYDVKNVIDNEAFGNLWHALNERLDPVMYLKFKALNYGYPEDVLAAIMRLGRATDKFRISEEQRQRIDDWIESRLGPKITKEQLEPGAEPEAPGARGRRKLTPEEKSKRNIAFDVMGRHAESNAYDVLKELVQKDAFADPEISRLARTALSIGDPRVKWKTFTDDDSFLQFLAPLYSENQLAHIDITPSYHPVVDTIAFPTHIWDVPFGRLQNIANLALHEYMHGLTSKEMRNSDSPFTKEIKRILDKARSELISQRGPQAILWPAHLRAGDLPKFGLAYAMENPRELISQAWMSPSARAFLDKIPWSTGISIFKKIVQTIAQHFGIKNESALDQIMRISLEVGRGRVEREARLREEPISEEPTFLPEPPRVEPFLPGMTGPGARGRGRRQPPPGQETFALPPGLPTDQPERAVPEEAFGGGSFTGSEVEATARDFWNRSVQAGGLANFDDFKQAVLAQHGPFTREQMAALPDQLWYLWQDTMMDRLMGNPDKGIAPATGDEISKMVENAGLLRKLQADYQQGFGEGRLADAPPPPPRAEARAPRPPEGWSEMSESIRNYFRQRHAAKQAKKAPLPEGMSEGLRRRYAAIGSLMDQASKEAGPRPEKPWNRTDIGPEEVDYTGGRRQFRALTPEEAQDPVKVGQIATEGAGVEASGKGAPPRTVSHNVLVLQGKDGKVFMASTWKDPRYGPRVTNPRFPTADSRKIDATLLADYKPIAVVSLRDPAKGFAKEYPSNRDFWRDWGAVGIEGTPGLRSSMFAGEHAVLGRVVAENVPRGTRGGLEEALPVTPERPPTARTLTAPPSPPIPAAPMPESLARPQPPLAEKLPPEAMPAIEARAAEETPYQPTKVPPFSEELAKRNISIMPSARGVRPGPAPYRLPASRPRPPTPPDRTPGAINRRLSETIANARENISALDRALYAMIDRRDVKDQIAGLSNAITFNAAQTAVSVKEKIRLASIKEPLVLLGRAMESRREAKARIAQGAQVRRAAMAVVAAGFDERRLDIGIPARGARVAQPAFTDLLSRARIRADMWAGDPRGQRSYQGRKDLAYIEQLRQDLRYAMDHWNDPELQRTAQMFADELHNQVLWEKANGRDVTEHANYIPGRYEGSFWNDNVIRFAGVRLVGQNFRLPKSFANPYEAIASGPYRMLSTDLGDLAEHRIWQGARNIENDIWFRGMTFYTDPVSGDPVAKSAVRIPKTDPLTGETTYRYHAPDLNYELVYPSKNSIPMAIRKGYVGMVDSFIDQGLFKGAPFVEDFIFANQMLKHGVILLWDLFHPGRVMQYAQALTGAGAIGWNGGYSALHYSPADLPEAVRKGVVTQKAADWATEPVQLRPHLTLTRQQILHELGSQGGLNTLRISDALYADIAGHIPILGKVVKPWNNWLFGKMIPGIMSEAAVTNLERLAKENPGTNISRLFRDVAKDTNIFFGNMGKQGIFRSRTMQQLGQLFFLAPFWQEGLFQKEIRAAARFGGAAVRGVGMDIPYRQGLPAMGALGDGMARGLAAYFIGAQIINLATRKQFTFQNQEEGHKLDAWVPTPGGGGFWLSPLSVFAEVTHDIIRYNQTKDTTWEAIQQIGENKLSPVGRMALILATGRSPMGQQYGTSMRRVAGALGQLLPFAGGAQPITLAPLVRDIAHRAAPNYVSPNPPGRLTRQLVSLAGVKVEPQLDPNQEMFQIAKHFMEREGLTKETGWKSIQTDDPSYTTLRQALRYGDNTQARNVIRELRKTHTVPQIEQAMKIWKDRPFTGSEANEDKLKFSLNAKQLDLYTKARLERGELYWKFEQELFNSL